jgi:hypothetical protein
LPQAPSGGSSVVPGHRPQQLLPPQPPQPPLQHQQPQQASTLLPYTPSTALAPQLQQRVAGSSLLGIPIPTSVQGSINGPHESQWGAGNSLLGLGGRGDQQHAGRPSSGAVGFMSSSGLGLISNQDAQTGRASAPAVGFGAAAAYAADTLAARELEATALNAAGAVLATSPSEHEPRHVRGPSGGAPGMLGSSRGAAGGSGLQEQPASRPSGAAGFGVAGYTFLDSLQPALTAHPPGQAQLQAAPQPQQQLESLPAFAYFSSGSSGLPLVGTLPPGFISGTDTSFQNGQ